jgi:hypothetical protein
LINNGKFGGRQIISPGYVQRLRQGTKANCGFGFYVWLNGCMPGQTQVNADYPSGQVLPGVPWIESAPSDMYFSLGLGPFTYVIPSLNMIVQATRSLIPFLARSMVIYMAHFQAMPEDQEITSFSACSWTQ